MEITATPPAFTSATQAELERSPTSAISSDFDTFLRMLTVQLQNQDPLNPVDSNDYAVQLATFSGVEQQVQTNDLLTQLVAENSAAGLAQLAGWVGKEARVPATGYWGGAPVTVVPDVANGADGAQLLVRNEDGAEVYRSTIPLDGEPVLWAGVDISGNPLPMGTYRFDTISLEGDIPVSEAPAQVYSRVAEVRSENGVSSIVLEGGSSIPAADVSAIREGP